MFALVAAWTLSGAVPGFFFAEWTYQQFQGSPPASAEILDLFRGAWGQTLLFGLGYAFAALDPGRHGVVALLGATGKVLYALRLGQAGDVSGFTLVALVGDLVFAGLIFTYVVVTGQLVGYFRRSKSSPTSPLALSNQATKDVSCSSKPSGSH